MSCIASIWGDAEYGACHAILKELQQRLRYIVSRWPQVKSGDCSFGSTVHIIRMILDIYEDGTVFHLEEVEEWIAVFNDLGKRAKKHIPKEVGFEAYRSQVIEDLDVILKNASKSTPRTEWEGRRDRDIEEYAKCSHWRVDFRLEYKAAMRARQSGTQ